MGRLGHMRWPVLAPDAADIGARDVAMPRAAAGPRSCCSPTSAAPQGLPVSADTSTLHHVARHPAGGAARRHQGRGRAGGGGAGVAASRRGPRTGLHFAAGPNTPGPPPFRHPSHAPIRPRPRALPRHAPPPQVSSAASPGVLVASRPSTLGHFIANRLVEVSAGQRPTGWPAAGWPPPLGKLINATHPAPDNAPCLAAPPGGLHHRLWRARRLQPGAAGQPAAEEGPAGQWVLPGRSAAWQGRQCWRCQRFHQ